MPIFFIRFGKWIECKKKSSLWVAFPQKNHHLTHLKHPRNFWLTLVCGLESTDLENAVRCNKQQTGRSRYGVKVMMYMFAIAPPLLRTHVVAVNGRDVQLAEEKTKRTTTRCASVES